MNLQYEELEIYLKKLNELSTKNQIILSPSTLYLDYCRKNTKYVNENMLKMERYCYKIAITLFDIIEMLMYC